jgi:hypothetical protein
VHLWVDKMPSQGAQIQLENGDGGRPYIGGKVIPFDLRIISFFPFSRIWMGN